MDWDVVYIAIYNFTKKDFKKHILWYIGFRCLSTRNLPLSSRLPSPISLREWPSVVCGFGQIREISRISKKGNQNGNLLVEKKCSIWPNLGPGTSLVDDSKPTVETCYRCCELSLCALRHLRGYLGF